MWHSLRAFPVRLLARLALASTLVMACTPSIGDKCIVSTDCSTRGDRLCDTSQPGGYCTQLNCASGSCPDEAACVLFGSSVPGCGYNDRAGPLGSRVGHSFCMAQCDSDNDCRPGYKCVDPRTSPWNAVILDDNQIKRSCLPVPIAGPDAGDAGDAGFVVDTDSGVLFSISPAPICAVNIADASAPIDASPASVDEGGAKAPPLFPVPDLDGGTGG